MSTKTSSSGDRPLDVILTADLGPYAEAIGRAWRRPIVEDPDRLELLGPPAPHRAWACVNGNHGVCPAARIDCSCGCHR